MRLDLDTSNAVTGFGLGPGPIQLPTGLKLKFPSLDLAGDDLRTCSYEADELTLWRDISYLEQGIQFGDEIYEIRKSCSLKRFLGA